MRSAPVCRDAPSRGGAKYATVTKSWTRANLRGFSRSGRIFAGGNRYGERPSTARKERRNNKQSNMYSLPQVARRGHAVDERSVVCTATATRTPRHQHKPHCDYGGHFFSLRRSSNWYCDGGSCFRRREKKASWITAIKVQLAHSITFQTSSLWNGGLGGSVNRIRS